jgi:hypothetical protein
VFRSNATFTMPLPSLPGTTTYTLRQITATGPFTVTVTALGTTGAIYTVAIRAIRVG